MPAEEDEDVDMEEEEEVGAELTAGERRMISKGKKMYMAGIRAIGGTKVYYTCGKKGGIRVARCLKGRKATKPLDYWAHRWELAMREVAAE